MGRQKGQGALEYLLLIGGAVVVAATVTVLILSLSGTQQNVAVNAVSNLQQQEAQAMGSVSGQGSGAGYISCKNIRDTVPSSPNGVYYIKPSSGPEFQVYCDMSGGGWTLVMKLSGTASTFGWSSAYWTNTATFNPQSPAFDTTEAKLESYSTVPFTSVKLDMRHPATGTVSSIQIPISATSLYSLIGGGSFTATSLGRNAWKGLLADGSLQSNCNLEGFNVQCGGTGTNARIGITSNQENDCTSCDSRIAFGGSGNYCGQDNSNSVGNEATCYPDNGNRSTKAFGYIFVK